MATFNVFRIGSRCNAVRFLGNNFTKQAGLSPISPLPLAVYKSSSSVAGSPSHNHARHWTAERAVTVGLLGLIPAALAYPSPPLDYALALSLVMHTHWGLEAIVVDYIRPNIFGATIPKFSVAALYGLSMFVFASLCYFNYADVGLAQAIRMFWKL